MCLCWPGANRHAIRVTGIFLGISVALAVSLALETKRLFEITRLQWWCGGVERASKEQG